MKMNDILENFVIYTSNEEKALLETIEGIRELQSFGERERVIIESLIRKSLVSKIQKNGSTLVMRNETQTTC